MKKLMLADKNILYRKTIPSRTITSSLSSFLTFSLIIRALLIAGILFFSLFVFAQPVDVKQQEADYKKMLTDRSSKIINTLGLTDSGKYDKVLDELVNQYTRVNAIHDESKTVIAEIKKQTLSDTEKAGATKKEEEKKSSRLLQLHGQFIAHLKESLTEEQLEKVKDGMTYRVFPITYAAFLDMLPNLTGTQKDKIYNWLKEARELAMDEGSSEDKHKVFGKYKGRINNYLSAEGYDLKKETADWQARVKEREAQKKNIQTN